MAARSNLVGNAVAAFASAVLLGTAGCGEEEAARAPARAPAADLAVEVRAEGEGGPVTAFRLRCPGDRRCERLERTREETFAAVPGDVACTELFGGPEIASVRGTAFGRRVDAEFSRRNGCEIARWDRAAWLLRAAP